MKAASEAGEVGRARRIFAGLWLKMSVEVLKVGTYAALGYAAIVKGWEWIVNEIASRLPWPWNWH